MVVPLSWNIRYMCMAFSLRMRVSWICVHTPIHRNIYIYISLYRHTKHHLFIHSLLLLVQTGNSNLAVTSDGQLFFTATDADDTAVTFTSSTSNGDIELDTFGEVIYSCLLVMHFSFGHDFFSLLACVRNYVCVYVCRIRTL